MIRTCHGCKDKKEFAPGDYDISKCKVCEAQGFNWSPERPESVNHPSHYGGKDNPYEAIKVIEAWKLGFNLGNTVKYISRAGKKGDIKEDLKKALFYLNREIENMEKSQ